MINQDLIASKWSDYLTQPIQNKAVIVTGGTTGIGRATAMLLASQGARVLIVGRQEKEMNDAMNDLKKVTMDNPVKAVLADLSKREEISRVFEEADKQLKGLDVLVNNAALPYQSIMDGSEEDWQYVVKTNLLGYMACSREAVQRMQKNGGGHIVNIGSMSADIREKGSSVYVATKAGIEGFSEALRKEVNHAGIHVSLIEPGAVGTDMSGGTREEQQKLEKEMKMLKAEDIAASVLYVLTQPKRVDVVFMQVRPHMQII